MRSAFGVEHTVSKSLSGGTFKPISQMTQAERKAIGGYRKAKGVSEDDKKYRTAMGQIKDLHSGKPVGGVTNTGKHLRTEKHRGGGNVEVYRHGKKSRLVPPGAEGFHVSTGGKRGTSYVHLGGGSGKRVETHELAHANPKRSSYRMFQITSNPRKLMREEARADYKAQGHFTTRGEKEGSGYAQSAHYRSNELAGKKSEARLGRTPVIGGPLKGMRRAMNTSRRQKTNLAVNNLTRTMNKPVKRREIDSYIKVQDKMRAADPNARPAAKKKHTKAIAGVAAGTAGAGGGVATYEMARNRRLKTHG
jgi:hypothetical protein